MRRRDLVKVLSSALALWSLGSRAQQSAPVIGYLGHASAAGFANFVSAFRMGLAELGYVENQNVVIDYRWTEGQQDRLAGFCADFIRRHVAVIMATGGTAPALAAKAATTTIPIVFTGGSDPVKVGLVASLGRPGANATGVLNIARDLTAKRLQLLRELVPKAATIAVLVNPASGAGGGDEQLKQVQEAARSTGQQIYLANATSSGDFDAVFATIMQKRAGALFVTADPVFTSQRVQLVRLAAKHALPASYAFRDLVVAGGLMSYGANLPDVHRKAGVYAARILKGAKRGAASPATDEIRLCNQLEDGQGAP